MAVPNWVLRLKKKQQVKGEKPENDAIHIYASDASISVVMITILGVDADHIDNVITVTKAKFAAHHRMVFLTDDPDFKRFRCHGVMFEYLPSLHEQRMHAEAMPWESFLRARWNLLLAKWKPLHVLAYGQNVESYLASTSNRQTINQAEAQRS